MIIKNIQQDIDKLKNLDKAVIDSSSLIYLSKLGLMEKTATVVRLMAPEMVFAETGMEPGLIEKIDNLKKDKTTTADRQVLNLALQEQCAVVSDDKKILHRAEQNGLDYFNALMLVLLLFGRNRLTAKETSLKLEQLKHIARYHIEIWDYGQKIFETMAEKRMKTKGRDGLSGLTQK